jgi:hypothetical protein
MSQKLISFHVHSENGRPAVVSLQLEVTGPMPTLAQVMELLQSSPGWNLSGQGSTADDAPATPTKPAKASKAATTPTPATKPAAALAKPAKGKPAAAVLDDEDEEDLADDEEDESPDEDDEDDDAAPATAPATGKLTLTPDDMKAMSALPKLRNVVQYLVETKGIRSRKTLISACSQIQSKIPTLARIEDLAERLPQAIELFDASIK